MFETIASILLFVGLIIKFIKNLLLKYVAFGVVLTFQFSIAAATIAFVLLFYGFVITSLISLYNFGSSIGDYINSSSSALSCFMGLLELLGILSACNQGYTLFFASVSTVLVFRLMSFTFFAMRMIANELFKLGVLLGQALS
ncbi:hypothetical protein FCU45_07935 [Sulfurimonas crateris]|uniref:Uncharacterized protein n=1 Tax=Sulfurimonas crateris TaxID=2574727 RepID=A0A4U2Z538_9BACT|nr:hypothetical protein [Sulfurimonas crateris]TKI68885.1 hypothetical protein FCU45_07935 [Sulfurimonas crateris]